MKSREQHGLMGKISAIGLHEVGDSTTFTEKFRVGNHIEAGIQEMFGID